MARGNVNATHWLLNRWHREAIPRLTTLHESVHDKTNSCFLLTFLFSVWPANLVQCALFNTLHSKTYAGMGSRAGISRGRFFIYAFVGATCYCKTFTLSFQTCVELIVLFSSCFFLTQYS